MPITISKSVNFLLLSNRQSKTNQIYQIYYNTKQKILTFWKPEWENIWHFCLIKAAGIPGFKKHQMQTI